MMKRLATVAVLIGVVLGSFTWSSDRRGRLHAAAPLSANCTAVADTRLEEKNPDHQYGSDPSLGLTLYGAGNVNGVGQRAEAALKFNCSAIPANSQIVTAMLEVNVTAATTDTFELFELKRPWTEAAATWNVYDVSLPWGVPGARDTRTGTADIATTVLGSFTGASVGTKQIALNQAGLAAVTNWVNGGTNNGVLLRPPLDDDDVGFQSKETANPATLDIVTTTGTPYTLRVLEDTRLEQKNPDRAYGLDPTLGLTLYGGGNVNGIGQFTEAALRFDLTGPPAGTTFRSATLNMNVTAPTVNTYELFEIKKSWTEAGATWNNYAAGLTWQVAGAKATSGANPDMGTTVLGSFTGAAVGLRSIPLAQAGVDLVTGWFNGAANNGILLRPQLANDDVGFQSRENSVPPVLRVTYNPPATASSVTVVQWNIHKGREECGLQPHSMCNPYNSLDEIAQYLANKSADVVSLNEVEFQNSTYQSEDQPLVLEQKLEQKTLQCWDRHFVDTNGGADGAAAHISGNLLLWRSSDDTSCGQPGRFHKQSIYSAALPPVTDGSRAVGGVTLLIGSRAVTFFTTHLCAPSFPGYNGCSASERQGQIQALKTDVGGFAAPRVIAGDFNASPSDSEIGLMTADYFDLWAQAVTAGTANSTNPNEPTSLNGLRFDYIFRSHDSPDTMISLLSAKIERQINPQTGFDVSDHFPMVAVITVQ